MQGVLPTLNYYSFKDLTDRLLARVPFSLMSFVVAILLPSNVGLSYRTICRTARPCNDKLTLSLCPYCILLALPVFFQEELKSKEVTEGEATTLQCRLSKAAPVAWQKGSRALQSGGKYQIKQEGPCAELTICDLDESDSGDYACLCGKQKTTASLIVNGKTHSLNQCMCP